MAIGPRKKVHGERVDVVYNPFVWIHGTALPSIRSDLPTLNVIGPWLRPHRFSIRLSLAAIAAMAAAVVIYFVFGQDLIPKASPVLVGDHQESITPGAGVL